MEQSILTGTKKILGLAEEYAAFDHDIMTHINSTFSILNQLGVGPDAGFGIEDDTATWSDLGVDERLTQMIRTYVFLKVRLLFDPPATQFLIEAMNKQIEEHEIRLTYFREEYV